MLFLPVIVAFALLIISVQVLLRLKNRWPAKFQQQQSQRQPSQQKSPAPIIKQAANVSGPAKQVHFAEVLCTRSKGQMHSKNGNTAQHVNNKNGHIKNKANNANKRIPRQRHNSENDKLNYSSEQLFKIIEVSCLSKEDVEMAVESLLNKIESGEAQWRQSKSDPLLKLRNQLRDSEASLAIETQNHEQTRARLAELKLQLQSERSSKNLALAEAANVKMSLNQLESLNEERQITEVTMKQTLSEIEEELQKLKDQLGRELSDAGQREQKLAIKMRQLRDGLSELFPDLKTSSDDWVSGYLMALKKLAKTVEELTNDRLTRIGSPFKESALQLDVCTDGRVFSDTFARTPSNLQENPIMTLVCTDTDNLDAELRWFP